MPLTFYSLFYFIIIIEKLPTEYSSTLTAIGESLLNHTFVLAMICVSTSLLDLKQLEKYNCSELAFSVMQEQFDILNAE